MTATYLANVDERLELTGSEGKIMIRHPHYADQIVLYDGQGKLIEQYSDQVTENGFVYEIKEMVDCVRNGKTESSIVPHRMTLKCLFDLFFCLCTILVRSISTQVFHVCF